MNPDPALDVDLKKLLGHAQTSKSVDKMMNRQGDLTQLLNLLNQPPQRRPQLQQQQQQIQTKMKVAENVMLWVLGQMWQAWMHGVKLIVQHFALPTTVNVIDLGALCNKSSCK